MSSIVAPTRRYFAHADDPVVEREMRERANSFPRQDLEEAAFAAVPPAASSSTREADPYDLRREREERIDREYESLEEVGR